MMMQWLLRRLRKRKATLVDGLANGAYDKQPWTNARAGARIHEIELIISMIKQRSNDNG